MATTLLVELGVYDDEQDFKNELGIVPPYWGNTTHKNPVQTTTAEWGPCFGTHQKVRWEREIEKYNSANPTYFHGAASATVAKEESTDWANFCRPGFLIIGAGKCGTSVRSMFL